MSTGTPAVGRLPAPERQLRAERNRFVAFAFAGGSLLLELDAAGRLRSALGAVSHLTGCAPEQLIGRPRASCSPRSTMRPSAGRSRISRATSSSRRQPWRSCGRERSPWRSR